VAAGQLADGDNVKVVHWQGVQSDFIKQVGLKRQYDGERIKKMASGLVGQQLIIPQVV